jgi:hypothetical protein
MSATVDFYLTRADESAKAASETQLSNVRERCLRSEAAWRVMAERLMRTEAKKQQDAIDKAKLREDEAEDED